MFWIGNKTAITAANDAASALVTSPDDPITTKWAELRQDASGAWFIPAHPKMETPAGCTAVDYVEMPPVDDLE